MDQTKKEAAQGGRPECCQQCCAAIPREVFFENARRFIEKLITKHKESMKELTCEINELQGKLNCDTSGQ